MTVSIGTETVVYGGAKVVGGVRIGCKTIIDDLVFIYGHDLVSIGDFVHIANSASLVGNISVSDFCSVSGGVRIWGASDTIDGSGLTNPCVPAIMRTADRRPVVLEKHSFIGSGCTILPGVTVGEGAVVGAMSLIKKDVEPWVIYAGNRVIRERPSKTILAMEELIRRYAYDENGNYRLSVDWLLALEDYVATNGVSW